MTSIYPLAILVALSACGQSPAPLTPSEEVRAASPPTTPSEQSSVAPEPTQVAKAKPACEGSLSFKLRMLYGPYFYEESLELDAKGDLKFSRPTEDGKRTLQCLETLDAHDRQAFASGFEELKLQDFPKSVKAPFVRDGTTLLLKGKCGAQEIKLMARNVFPLPIRELLDRSNAMVADAGCDDRFRLPTGEGLKRDADSSGVTEMCADDCKACNTCAFE